MQITVYKWLFLNVTVLLCQYLIFLIFIYNYRPQNRPGITKILRISWNNFYDTNVILASLKMFHVWLLRTALFQVGLLRVYAFHSSLILIFLWCILSTLIYVSVPVVIPFSPGHWWTEHMDISSTFFCNPFTLSLLLYICSDDWRELFMKQSVNKCR